eukprot:scaffold17456_cov51-Phaeocystis_antarctica.AAC.1
MQKATARAEGLTLLVAESSSGYFGVYHQSSKVKPYRTEVRRGGKMVSLGCFATAEEAALCVARTPEGQAAAKRAAAAPPLTSEGARQQAQAEGLTLRVSNNKTGYLSVSLTNPGKPKPFTAQVWRGGKQVHLGSFATAEEAALCIARSPEGQAAAQRAAAAVPPLTSEEARQQAQAEGLALLVANNGTGYSCVYQADPVPRRLGGFSSRKLYMAQVRRRGKDVYLGSFATAEEAALHVARSPEGQAAAQRAAAALTSEEARQQAQAQGLTLIVAKNTTGYFGVHMKNPGQPKPYQTQVRRGGKKVSLGCFATAEEAALCVARSPEGQAAAQRAAATGDDDGGDDTGEESEEETVEVLDAVEVLVASDDEGEEALALEAEKVAHVAERKRARETEHEPRRRGASR